ncbi:SusC/RagA family TonB-linked outer membrane protein [Chitinophaga lutea]|nr:TonB-dependent receptor [Chitinophaga lutea]
MVLAFALCLLTAVPANAQSAGKPLHLTYNNTTIHEVLVDLQKKTGVDIAFTEKLGLKHRKIDQLVIRGESLESVLHRLLDPLDVKILKGNNGLTLVKKEQAKEQESLTGKIVSADGAGIPGASIRLKKSNISTVSGADGAFRIAAPTGEDTLTVSFIGYATKEVAVAPASADLTVTLAEGKAVALGDVVVVGYGKQKKTNLTGSVEVIDGARLRNRPVMNVSQAMQGTVSGVQFNYGAMGYEPGAKMGIQIRGQGAPFVLIDGTQGDLNDVDPNDIESISVLKDAAASAIYGARAPYGVVLITTKSGALGKKVQVNFSANGAVSTPIDKPHMLDAYTFVKAMNEMHDNQGVARLFTEETIDRIIAYMKDPGGPQTIPDPGNPKNWGTYLLSNGNNDWMDIHFGNGHRNQQNLSVSGGGENLAYFISAGHTYEKGILKFGQDDYRRVNLNSKLDVKLTDWWKFTSNTRLMQSQRNKPGVDGTYSLALHHVLRTHPNQWLKSPNGHYSNLSRIPAMLAATDETVGRELTQRFATVFTPVKNWEINADYSVDLPYSDYEKVFLTAYEDMVDGSMSAIQSTVPSYISKEKTNSVYSSFNLYTSYKYDLLTDHHLSLMAGYQQESNRSDALGGLKRSLLAPSVPSMTTAIGEMQVYDAMSHWATQGYFARFNYSYRDKYLLEVNGRYDGTSIFARSKRWGFFPSLSAGWNIDREQFWEQVSPYVNAMKIRASWGRLGNQRVAAYQDLPLLNIQPNLNWIVSGNRPAYTTGPNLINPELTWESSESLDLGIEMSFLKQRLSMVLDIYQRMTFDRLGPAKALPAVLGATVPRENNSELRTRGWDLSLAWKDKVGGFSYGISALVSDYRSVVTKYNNPTGILTTEYVGKTMGEIWGYETVGLIGTKEDADRINSTKSQNFISAQVWRTGDVEYRDLNGDGKINQGMGTVTDPGDLKVIGNTTPRYQYSLTLNAGYRNFDVSVFFQGVGKRDYWLSGNMFWGFNAWNQSSLFPHHLDYYRDAEAGKYSGLGVNTGAYYPRPYSDNAQYRKNQQAQTRYLQSGAYIRLKNLQIGYALPKTWARKAGLQKTRLFLSGENLWTRTSITKGFDPETALLGEYGNGKNLFVQAVFAAGINVSF